MTIVFKDKRNSLKCLTALNNGEDYHFDVESFVSGETEYQDCVAVVHSTTNFTIVHLGEIVPTTDEDVLIV